MVIGLDVWGIVGLLLGSSVIGKLIDLILDRVKRKDTIDDKKAEAEKNKTADQIEELRAETGEQFRQVDGRINGLEGKIDIVKDATDNLAMSTKAQAYDRIRHLGLSYIKAGCIGADELRNLGEMHKAYQKLGGDGFLDTLMEKVNSLRIKPED